MARCENCRYFNDNDREDASTYDAYWCALKGKYVLSWDSCSSFESNEGGGSGCYLTSACVDYLGKADDCEELTALRKFRDTYMKSTEGGQKLVEEYYAVAPEIVNRINSSGKKEYYYAYINGVIDKCVKLISQNENEKTMQEYVSMVEFLRKEFSL